jgi:iron complex outermembrane receptor protein
VTAQRREEALLDVPASMAVVGPEETEVACLTSMADFFRRLPSVAVIGQGAAPNNIIICGIQTPTSIEVSVADVYLDEQRVTSASATADPRAFDRQRVAVLGGPQSTLFGGGSLAGTLRYITNRANVTKTEANVAIGLSNTGEGSSNGAFDGMHNLSLDEDKLAVRCVGYHDDGSGYLKNSLLGRDEVATIENQGGRIGVRYTPSGELVIDYKHLVQGVEQLGFAEERGTQRDLLEQGGHHDT